MGGLTYLIAREVESFFCFQMAGGEMLHCFDSRPYPPAIIRVIESLSPSITGLANSSG